MTARPATAEPLSCNGTAYQARPPETAFGLACPWPEPDCTSGPISRSEQSSRFRRGVGADAILLGRTTYQLMYPYWSAVTDPQNQVATALNTLPKFVVSRSMTDAEADWRNNHSHQR